MVCCADEVLAKDNIPKLEENNVRQGFFHHWDYMRLKTALPDYLKPIVTLAYFTGLRKSEILGLSWDQIDFHERIVMLNPGTTKNKDPRLVPMSEELFNELEAQRRIRDAKFPFCKHVFFNHSTGRPIRDFRTAWDTACRRLGLSDSHFHDFRRCGVRNLVRAGVPERVAMAISGHKTRSVFDRYNIIDEDDLKAAGKAVETYLKTQTGTLQAQLAEIEEVRKKRKSASA